VEKSFMSGKPKQGLMYSVFNSAAKVLYVVVLLLASSTLPAEEIAWNAPPLEQAIVIRDGRTKQVLSWEKLITDLSAADAVFLGESHTDETTHSLQLAVYEALLKEKQGQVVLGLEMFERDVQPQLDDYLAGKIDEQEFLKVARPWQNYHEAYRPLIEHAKQQQALVLASNFPAPLRRRMMREGPEVLQKLSDAEKSQAPRELLPNTPAYWKRVDNATRGHQGMMPQETDTERLTSTQSLWDNSMGEACADALDKYAGHLVLHVNGGFHSAHWDGTVHQLKLRKPNAQVKTVAIAPASNPATAESNWEAIADYEVSVETRATNLDQGKRTVQVGGELEYRFHLPEGATDNKRFPLLIWLPEDGLTAEEGMEYCREFVGNSAAIAVIEAPYKFVDEDLAVGRRWYWSDTFAGDVFTVARGIEEVWAYLARHYPIDPERVIVMGEGTGATMAVLMAVHAHRMGINATAFSPTQYVKLKDIPLPEFFGDDQPPRRSLTVMADADQKEWWTKELEQYRTTGMECDWQELQATGVSDSLLSALVAADERKVFTDNAPCLVVQHDSPRARHWARLQANWLSDDDRQIVVVDEAPAGKEAIETTIDPAKLREPKVLPPCPGPFGGTTILVLPSGLSAAELQKWLDLEKNDPLAKDSRFHRVRIAEGSGERSLASVLSKLKGENRTNVLIVPAEFFATPTTMRSLRDQVHKLENEMTLNWLPGLGGRKGAL
jgi:uncharacterized iron-regulated protein/predicted esterase